jgi:TorA maturation chaperone TorD/Fe-S-cluster-containing hydrogenase component 2
LAEALADTAGAAAPEWLAYPGRQWPLFEPANKLAEESPSPAMTEAVKSLVDLGEGSLETHEATWKKLLSGNSRPPLALYESMHRNGRLFGPVMFAVKAEYQQVGLEVEGPELPDHITIELEFLTFLTEQEAKGGQSAKRWRQTRRKFIRNHAAEWMPAIGQLLASTDDPAWRAIGHLLTAVITLSEAAPSNRQSTGLPVLHQASRCSLCGFCVQVCPVRALRINEDTETTRLYLLPDLCNHCRKCESICGPKALSLERAELSGAPVILRQSPRAICPGCGQATISEAELTAVSARLGEHPQWLDYCLECRGRGFYDVKQVGVK